MFASSRNFFPNKYCIVDQLQMHNVKARERISKSLMLIRWRKKQIYIRYG